MVLLDRTLPPRSLGQLACLLVLMVPVHGQSRLPGESRPFLGFYDGTLQVALEEQVKSSVRDLGNELGVHRDLAVRKLTLIGEPAIAPVRAAVDDGQDEVRRAALRALVALSPTSETFETLDRLARTSPFDVAFLSHVLYGEPVGPASEREERARRLGTLARAPKAILAIPPLLGLLRLDLPPPNLQELRETLQRGSGDPGLDGMLAVAVGRLDPGSSSALIPALSPRRSPDFVRACAAWAMSHRGGTLGVEGADVDLDSASRILAACAALARIPRNPQDVDAMRDRVLRDDSSDLVRAGFVTAIALANCDGVEKALLDIAASPTRREGLRGVLLQAAVRRRDPALLLAVGASVPPEPLMEARLFAAACGLLTVSPEALPPVLLPGDPPSVFEPLVAKARERLRHGPVIGCREAAAFLLLLGAPWPGDIDPKVALESDHRFLARLGGFLHERSGAVEARTLRRIGMALAMENQVDPEAQRDDLLHELLWTGLGRGQKPFELKGLNDLSFPDGAQNFPVAHDGPFYEDLRFYLGTHPFRTPLERYLRGR
ncbi:MAG: hypothetical protein H6834_11445 [Planctomycetes bacterium]|nr:hypothetical protein [Planctomycetota bacterium]